MSFCVDTKLEIIANSAYEDCCQASHLYGFLCFFSKLSQRELLFSCEKKEIIEYLISILANRGIAVDESNLVSGKKIHSFKCEDPYICERIYTDYGFADGSLQLHINEDIFRCSECHKAFLAGVFIACGTITEPSKGYHLEFTTHRARMAKDLCEFLEKSGFSPKLSKRGYDHVIYFKDSSQIEDLLTYIGAGYSSMELMQEKILKSVRNQVTRRVNCDKANVDKTIAAAAEDLKLFSAFKDKGGYKHLSEELQVLADLRITRPDMSLSELASELSDGITRSGVSHRLRKIRSIAKEYLDGTID